MRRILFVFAITTALLGACGGQVAPAQDETGGAVTCSDPIPVQSACDQVLDEWCTRAAQCAGGDFHAAFNRCKDHLLTRDFVCPYSGDVCAASLSACMGRVDAVDCSLAVGPWVLPQGTCSAPGAAQ